MKNFSDTLAHYSALYAQTGRIFSEESMRSWFESKKTITRSSIEGITFKKKTAVVLVGISAIGKSTYAKKFLETHPNFECISFDDCYYEAFGDSLYTGEDADLKTFEIFDEKFQKLKRKNLIIDGFLIGIDSRAAFLQILQKNKYEIHIVYFPISYAEKHIDENFVYRAIDHVLFARMINNDPAVYRAMITVKIDMVKNHAERYNITIPEVIEKFRNDRSVVSEIALHKKNYQEELINFSVAEQEKSGAFMWGADYYYEIT